MSAPTNYLIMFNVTLLTACIDGLMLEQSNHIYIFMIGKLYCAVLLSDGFRV